MLHHMAYHNTVQSLYLLHPVSLLLFLLQTLYKILIIADIALQRIHVQQDRRCGHFPNFHGSSSLFCILQTLFLFSAVLKQLNCI